MDLEQCVHTSSSFALALSSPQFELCVLALVLLLLVQFEEECEGERKRRREGEEESCETSSTFVSGVSTVQFCPPSNPRYVSLNDKLQFIDVSLK